MGEQLDDITTNPVNRNIVTGSTINVSADFLARGCRLDLSFVFILSVVLSIGNTLFSSITIRL